MKRKADYMVLKSIDRSEALRYMGSSCDETLKFKDIFDECEKELLNNIEPRYVYRLFDIKNTDNGINVVGTDLILEGNDIKNHLTDCKKCILFAATLSSKCDMLIRRLQAYDMVKACITDALASAAIEQVCDTAQSEIISSVAFTYVTERFSPGYGDLSLSIQKKLSDVLETGKRIGLNVTDSMMLVPSKSVTAIIGISDKKIKNKKRSCKNCNMYKYCLYRKGGNQCGF